MPMMINYDGDLIRISPKDNNKIELSKNNGSSWILRYTSSSVGSFLDLMENGSEILATTQNGLYFSRNKGATWILRKKR